MDPQPHLKRDRAGFPPPTRWSGGGPERRGCLSGRPTIVGTSGLVLVRPLRMRMSTASSSDACICIQPAPTVALSSLAIIGIRLHPSV
jgi:hypothetical protein